ncbi:hypothetical protein [Halioxenophilus sp. WMMB6]|uniref:hypothetical protein n=1 Tax=Halioxenophilus sp. WMMB6 TaxID=3073815 RepID=UPI00295E7187|nr:hypothetical protein [Halioxenophilus sp. WMMB6]
MVLSGQLMQLQQEPGLLFIGIPWVTDLRSLTDLGLSMEDYSRYEPTTYLFLLTEAQRSSLEQSETIQQQLQALNESFTKPVERRTARLTQINEELLRSQEKLHEEMRQRQEMELRLAQKMEALGQLSAGITP